MVNLIQKYIKSTSAAVFPPWPADVPPVVLSPRRCGVLPGSSSFPFGFLYCFSTACSLPVAHPQCSLSEFSWLLMFCCEAETGLELPFPYPCWGFGHALPFLTVFPPNELVPFSCYCDCVFSLVMNFSLE